MNTKNKIIPIAFCFDKNYVIPASVAFYSLLENSNKKYFYKFYVLHSDISEIQQKKLHDTIKPFKNICKLTFIDMNNKFAELWEKNYNGDHFSKEVLYKLLLASIFHNYEKIIVSDVDVVFLGDISESYIKYDTNSNSYLAGVKTISKISNYYIDNYSKYWNENDIKIFSNICGGYLVLNLKKIRNDDMEKKFMSFLEKNCNKLNQLEQDVLNMCCNKKITYLPLEYVSCSYLWDYFKNDKDFNDEKKYSVNEIKHAMSHPIQLHYATSIKPWKNVNCTKSEEWFKYIVKTPFLNDFLNDLDSLLKITPKDKVQKNQKLTKIFFYIKRNPLFFVKKRFYQKLWKYFQKKN